MNILDLIMRSGGPDMIGTPPFNPNGPDPRRSIMRVNGPNTGLGGSAPDYSRGGPVSLVRPGPSALPARNPNQKVLPSVDDLEKERGRYIDEAYAPMGKQSGSPFDFKRDFLPAAGVTALLALLGAKGDDIASGLQGFAGARVSRWEEARKAAQEEDRMMRQRALVNADLVGDRITARNQAATVAASQDREDRLRIEGQVREDRQRAEDTAAQRARDAFLMAGKAATDSEKAAVKATADYAKWARGQLPKLEVDEPTRQRGLELLAKKEAGTASFYEEQELTQILANTTADFTNTQSLSNHRTVQTDFLKSQWEEYKKLAPDRAKQLAETVNRLVAQNNLTKVQTIRLYNMTMGVGPEFALREAEVQARIMASGVASRADLQALIDNRQKELQVLFNTPGLLPKFKEEETARLRSDISAYQKQLDGMLTGKANNAAGRGGAPSPMQGKLNANPYAPLNVVPGGSTLPAVSDPGNVATLTVDLGPNATKQQFENAIINLQNGLNDARRRGDGAAASMMFEYLKKVTAEKEKRFGTAKAKAGGAAAVGAAAGSVGAVKPSALPKAASPPSKTSGKDSSRWEG